MEIVHPEEKKNWEERTNVDWWWQKETKCKHWKYFNEKSKDKKWIWWGTKKKKKNKVKKTYAQRVKERMGEYYEEKPFKIHAKEKEICMVKFKMLLKK